MSPYRTPAPFTCPQCGAQHDRGWVDGVETYRCLRCGYVGKESVPQPLTDHEFKDQLLDLVSNEVGPFYANPLLIARVRKVFTSAYDIPSTSFFGEGFVGRLFGNELYQTPDIPDGWIYAPPGGDPDVLHQKPADVQYLHRIDPTAEPYVPPRPRLSRYDLLVADE